MSVKVIARAKQSSSNYTNQIIASTRVPYDIFFKKTHTECAIERGNINSASEIIDSLARFKHVNKVVIL